MRPAILNREFKHPTDGFYQIEAKGFHPAITDDGEKIVQVVDDKAIASIVNRFNEASGKSALRHGSEMLIDHEHFRHEADKESRAYGWAQELTQRTDGVYARNRWTATGQPAVDGGDYRFFSTEYDGPVFEEVSAKEIPADIRNKYKGYKFMRPMQLTGLSLTNQNNNRGQKPITNRETDLDIEPGSPASSSQNNTKNKMKSIASKLGLDQNTDEAGIAAAVDQLLQLRNRGDITVADLKTLREEHAAFKTGNDTLLGEQCDVLMSAHGIKSDDKVRNRLKPVLIGLKNREDRAAALVEFGFKPLEAGKEGKTARILNRGEGTPAAQETAASDEYAKCDEIKSLVASIKNRDKCNTDVAMATARREKPALFA